MQYTVKNLRESIKNKTLNDFKFQEYIKFFAENLPTMALGEELAFKEYIRKGANYLDIPLEDVQATYNSFKNRR